MKKSICLMTMDITLKGGIERVVCNLANSLTNDFNVEIVSFFNSNNLIVYKLDSRVNVKYIQENRIFKYSSYKFWLLFSVIKNRKVLNGYNFDKIVIMYPLISILFIIIFPKLRKCIIPSEHSEYFSQGYLLRYFRKKTYIKVNKIVTLTNSGKYNFQNDGLIVDVIPNSVTEFSSQHQWNFKQKPQKTTYCLFAGRFEPVKQVDHVLHIANKLINDSQIHFDILGDGPEFDVITNFAKKINLTNITFHGSISNIYDFYNKCHILLITSITEAFPMVVIEAMSFGCVVICYDSQIGTCEIVTNDIDGFIVPSGDIQNVYEKIQLLSMNNEVFDAMSRAAIMTSQKYRNNSINKFWKKLIVE
jgi:glycosyltransferase involved in cell wall biosynthesis